MKIDAYTVLDLVRDASRVSDRGSEGLHAFANAFVEAHSVNPGELSVEVGTRNGGSAILFLGLLAHLYPPEHRPCLFTVDPYGSKPYDGGDQKGAPIYTDVNYIAMKQLLAPFPNHVHFHMRSEDFFGRILHLPYWRPGAETVPVTSVADRARVSAPVGVELSAGRLAFALLDGEHDKLTIQRELFSLWNSWMAPNALVMVDNVDTDKSTRSMIEKWFRAEISANGQWALVRGFR